MKKLSLMLITISIFLSVGFVSVLVIRKEPIPLELQPLNNYSEIKYKVHSFDDALNSITESTLRKNLFFIASDEMEGRMTGKRGHFKSAKFVRDQYESFGLKTMYHRFTEGDIGVRIQGVNGPKGEMGERYSYNVYAWIEGNDPILKNEVMVVGAHLDHIGVGGRYSRTPNRREIHNGADDNASGTVAILEIAQAFSMLKDKVKRTVVFQSYSAEEMGLHGSRFYCNNPVFPQSSPSIKKHVFMLNLDMVGWLGRGRYFASFGAGESSIDISVIINDLNRKYSFARQITGRSSGGSDHASFYNKRVPIAFLHTGLHPHYHTPDDTADKIDYNGLEKVARYGFELAWLVAQSDDRPRFTVSNFEPLPYIHDHGHPEVPFSRHSYHREEKE